MYQQPPSNQNVPTYPPPEQPYSQYPQPPPQDYPSYPPPPYQQPPPPKRKRRIWLWIVGIIVVLIVIGSFASRGGTSTSTSTPPAATQAPATGNTPAATQPPAATAAPTKPPTWTTVQTFKGNGSKKTASFTVPDNWRIAWTCSPGSFGGTDYNVIITVENTDGSYADSGVNSTCSKSNTHDTTNVPAGGTFILDIISEGDWTIAVQVLK
jgi:hypothetical protein